MASDEPIDLTLDLKDLLPQAVLDGWLPDENKSILFLFQEFNQYPLPPCHYIQPTNLQSFLHETTIQEFDYTSLLRVQPLAVPEISKAYQGAIKKSKSPIHSVTLQPQQGPPVTLPVWIFHYWAEIGRVVDIKKRWKVALTWVKHYSTFPEAQELSQALLLGLSYFSWSHHAAYTCDITPLLSNSSKESFLNTFHIDEVMGKIQSQYEAQHGPNVAKHYFFATVDHMNAIVHFYGPNRGKKDDSFKHLLMSIENEISLGDVDEFCGVMHLPSLHWVSIVINFRQSRILYGDSLGQGMQRREHKACKEWIEHLIKRSGVLTGGKITISNLPTGQQLDSNSCGLFALNSIAHHYLNEPLLPSDSTTLACRRMEIALDIINKMTVCISFVT